MEGGSGIGFGLALMKYFGNLSIRNSTYYSSRDILYNISVAYLERPQVYITLLIDALGYAQDRYVQSLHPYANLTP